jgi:hypothetical protein
MKRTKLIFNLSFFILLALVISYQVVYSGPEPETFEQCTERLGGATDTNCEKCEHLLKQN